jgi:hypothetical protein
MSSAMVWCLILDLGILTTITLVSIFVPNGLWSLVLILGLQKPDRTLLNKKEKKSEV